jgi:hypothetical protein
MCHICFRGLGCHLLLGIKVFSDAVRRRMRRRPQSDDAAGVQKTRIPIVQN